jgi:hypothetical protein
MDWDLDPWLWGSVGAAVALLSVAIYFKPSRFAVAVVLLVGGAVLTALGSAAFLGVPIVITALALFYSWYSDRKNDGRTA